MIIISFMSNTHDLVPLGLFKSRMTTTGRFLVFMADKILLLKALLSQWGKNEFGPNPQN